LNVDGTYSEVLKEKVIVQKHIPPNAGAVTYGLNNLAPNRWRKFVAGDEYFIEKFKRPEDIFDRMNEEELKAYIEDADQKLEEQERNSGGSGTGHD